MAGRGRRGGRGRGAGLSFSVESVGFLRGDPLPPPIAQPPALFPPLEFKPTPLVTGEEQDYLLNLKQELRGTLRDSGFYIQPVSLKKDISRYSDKYQQSSITNDIKCDWNRFPKELKPLTRGKKRPFPSKSSFSKKSRKNISERDITNKLEQLESAEKTTSDEEQEDEGKNNEEVERDDEEYYDEEEQEEGTDYIADYFSNGEDYLDEDDNMDDGPTY